MIIDAEEYDTLVSHEQRVYDLLDKLDEICDGFNELTDSSIWVKSSLAKGLYMGCAFDWKRFEIVQQQT